MPRPTRLGQRGVRGLIVIAIAVLGLAALALNNPLADQKSGPFAGEPMPALYPDNRLPYVEGLATSQSARAHRALTHYLRDHPVADDRAFTAWALNTVGPPPAGKVEKQELAFLHRIGARRTPAGIAAATWLEAHGKKDVWKLYLKQYAQLASKAAAKRAKRLFKRTYKLSKTLVDTGKSRFARPSPYLVDPSLHALNQRRFADKTKFSYPSKHGVISAAMAVLLAHLEPHRATEFQWMRDEIAYSRLYAGGHYPSDFSASVYLGVAAADYVLAVDAR